MADLITTARAKVNIPSATSADDATIETLITAASRAIQRYCRRDFAATAYDELYHGSATPRLLLRQYPIIAVQAVRCRPATVLTVTNTDTALNQQARVAVTATGLALTRVASGVSTTNAVTFAGNATLTALAAAVVGVGSGWTAQVLGDYGSWPAADLRAPQGARSARGRPAGLQLHTAELTDFRIDERRGWLLRAAWPGGVHNFRVQYTAGYATVPEDVQEACAELVATWFVQRGRDLSLRAENAGGSYSYEADVHAQLPRRLRAVLKPYRAHPLAVE